MTANEFGSDGQTSSRPDAGVWLRAAPSRKRRPAPLTTERIVAAAVELLDTDGVAQLTMRRLASQLQVSATALYWHVQTKDDVLDLALDHIFEDVAVPPQTSDWRGDAAELIRRWRAAMLDHSWAPGLIGRPMLGPNVLARTEFLQEALARGGLAGLDLEVATHALANYVIGAAATQAAWRTVDSTRGHDHAREGLQQLKQQYPTLSASGHLDPPRRDDSVVFDRGLDAILNGITARPA
ncbi:MAG: TetR/AcrR family transcriptional regulator [Pseudonocardia sp.]|nr:TetR/AcrR family transcriptional regulator [Pseudonocardia sp.]